MIIGTLPFILDMHHLIEEIRSFISFLKLINIPARKNYQFIIERN